MYNNIVTARKRISDQDTYVSEEGAAIWQPLVCYMFDNSLFFEFMIVMIFFKN